MELIKWDKISQEISVAENWDEMSNLHTRLKAYEAIARQEKMALPVHNKIGRYLIDIQAKKGEWLKENVKRGNVNTLKQYTESSNSEPSVGLPENVNKRESYQAQQTATIPKEIRDEIMNEIEAETKRITETELKKRYKKKKIKEKKAEIIKAGATKNIPANIQLLEGDLFDVIKNIPDNSIDLLNTDPPYFILNEKWDEFKNKKEFMLFTEKWMGVVMPKVKNTGRVYISFSQWFQYDFYEILKKNNFYDFIFKQNIIWYYKNNNQPSNRKEYRYMYEPIFYLYGKDAPPLNFTEDTYGETQQNVWEIATPQSNFKEGKFHASQKPLELYRRIIKTGSFDGDTILDCFAGSGTTGIICKELNRNCILIEKDAENIQLIKGRI